jgi:hypothetical protein
MADTNPETLAYATDANLDAAQWKSRPRFPRVPAVAIAVGGLLFFHLMFYLGLFDWLHRHVGNSVEPYTVAAAFLPVLIQKRDRWSLVLGVVAIIGLCVVDGSDLQLFILFRRFPLWRRWPTLRSAEFGWRIARSVTATHLTDRPACAFWRGMAFRMLVSGKRWNTRIGVLPPIP